MSIPSEFAAYTRELDFVNQFVIPLFRRLGFSQIFDLQGSNEFGKDIIFGDIDAFGHVNYFAVQAKFVDKIGKGEAETLAKQCKEAFQNPFTHPRRQTQERIGRYYAVNGGEFSDQFRQAFRNAIPPELHGCVTCLDGNDLLTLDRGAGLRNVRDARQKLNGLRNEIVYNTQICNGTEGNKGLRQWLAELAAGGNVIPSLRLWCDASSLFMANPESFIEMRPVISYWVHCRWTNETLDTLDVPTRPRANLNLLAQSAINHVNKALEFGTQVGSSVEAKLRELAPLAAP